MLESLNQYLIGGIATVFLFIVSPCKLPLTATPVAADKTRISYHITLIFQTGIGQNTVIADCE